MSVEMPLSRVKKPFVMPLPLVFPFLNEKGEIVYNTPSPTVPEMLEKYVDNEFMNELELKLTAHLCLDDRITINDPENDWIESRACDLRDNLIRYGFPVPDRWIPKLHSDYDSDGDEEIVSPSPCKRQKKD